MIWGKPWYVAVGAGLLVIVSLLAIGNNLPHSREERIITRNAPPVVYHDKQTVTKEIVRIPTECRAALHWSEVAVDTTAKLGTIYGLNAGIISETHVAVATKDIAKLNELATRQNTLYNQTGPLNDLLSQAIDQYTKMRPACESALH